MSSTPTGTGLEEVRSFHRLLVLELVFAGIIVAGLVNLCASAFYNYLTATGCERDTALWWTKFFAALLLLAVGIFLIVLHKQRVVEVTGLTLMLPVHVPPDHPRAAILSHPHYQPALYAHRFFARPGPDFRREFKDAWPGPNPLAASDFAPGHPCWDSLMQLIQALVVQFLKFYGEHTLTPNGYFKGEFRRLAGRLRAAPLKRDLWPVSLRANPFLSSDSSSPLQSFMLPKNSRLKERRAEPLPQERPGRRDWAIATPYGSLIISFSPNWTILTADNKAKALAQFPEADANATCFMLLPIELRLSVRRFYFSFEKMRYLYWRCQKVIVPHRVDPNPPPREQMQYHYWWFQKLMDNMRRRMSWGYFLRGGELPEEDY
jgi:hypothetical protein